MIIVPEIETVILQPPRTGSSSVKDAVLAKYKSAFMLYRHMEYAGLPSGYDRWRVICQVREPHRRLESLFKYMRDPELRGDTDPVWLESVRKATEKGFEHWLLHDQYIFANPTPSGYKAYRPRYQVNYAWREQIKSQSLYAKEADELLFFESLVESAQRMLGIELDVKRGATEPEKFKWTPEMEAHLQKWHQWDLYLYDPTVLYPHKPRQ